jgi:hypothetical protein
MWKEGSRYQVCFISHSLLTVFSGSCAWGTESASSHNSQLTLQRVVRLGYRVCFILATASRTISASCAWGTESASLLALWTLPSSPSCRCHHLHLHHLPPHQTLPHQPPQNRQETPCTPLQGSRQLPCRQSTRSRLLLLRGCCCCCLRSPMLLLHARCGCLGGGSPAGSSRHPPGQPAGAGRGTAAGRKGQQGCRAAAAAAQQTV